MTEARAALIDLDPDLAEGLDAPELAAARRILVPVATAAVGGWRPPTHVVAGAGALGFLVVEGLLTRRVMIADTRCTELLGRGDILRPWSTDAAEVSSVPVEADWQVVDNPARLALLDANVTRQLGHRPTITCEILDRAIRRSRWLGLQLAICHTRHVETRLLMILWHFARPLGPRPRRRRRHRPPAQSPDPRRDRRRPPPDGDHGARPPTRDGEAEADRRRPPAPVGRSSRRLRGGGPPPRLRLVDPPMLMGRKLQICWSFRPINMGGVAEGARAGAVVLR